MKIRAKDVISGNHPLKASCVQVEWSDGIFLSEPDNP